MHLSPPSTRSASVIMFVAASMWGLYWLPLRWLEDMGVDGGWAIALLNFPAAIVLAVVVIWSWGKHLPHLGPAIAIGIFTGAGLALYGSGLVLSSVVRATLLFYLVPVWATLIGLIWLGEKANWQRWAAIVVGLCGLVLLVSGGGSVPLNIGDLFAILSGMFWAVGAALIMRFGEVPVPGMVMVQFVVTGAGALALAAIAGIGGFSLPEAAALEAALPSAAVISVVVFLPAVAVIFWVQKFLFPGRAGLLMMSEVLMAVLSASILLPEERMSLTEWTGAALIISACLIEVLLTPQQTPNAAKA
ncbi:MAG: DMT family transporter [Pseudomonadota bacterium]